MGYKCKILWVIIFTMLASNGYAKSFFEQGIEHKTNGNFAESERFLILSAREKNDFDSWYNLGLVRGYQKKYASAIKALQEAVTIEKSNNDARVALARVYGWKKKYQKALAILDDVLGHNATHAEAKVLKEKILLFQDNQRKKESAKSQIAKSHKNQAPDYKWRLNIGNEYSNIRRVNQKNWHRQFVELQYHPTTEWSFRAKGQNSKRFGNTNEYFSAGLTHMKKNNYLIAFDYGRTNEASFLPKSNLRVAGEKNIYHKRDAWLNDLWLMTEFGRSHFNDNKIQQYKLGVRSRFLKEWTLTLKRTFIRGNNAKTLRGWYGRIDWQTPYEPLRVFLGHAKYPEAQTLPRLVIVKTRSRFYGFAYDLSDRYTFYGAFGRDSIKSNYINHTYSGTLSVKF